MNKPSITTKADTLISLMDIVKKSRIEQSMIVHVGEYRQKKMSIFHNIAESFKGCKVVVRSSNKSEDTVTGSNAGCFKSVLDVAPDDEEALFAAFDEVIESYAKAGHGYVSDSEQILVQKQTEDMIYSGVIFTRDIIYNRPYYLITYDEGEKTDSVTSGKSGKTKWIAKNASREFIDYAFCNLVEAVKEIEEIFADVEALDIEFGIDSHNVVTIFQVRPLAAAIGKHRPITDKQISDTKSFAKCHYLDTNHILSDMAYWNPSEIIGSNPRPLDFSLFRELITSGIWNSAISVLGYTPLEVELMQKIGNKPYISVDYTLEGLIPASIQGNFRYRLTEYYKDRLRADSRLHDKLEEALLINAYDFSTEDRLEKLREADFSDEEISEYKTALLELTRNTIKNYKTMSERDKADMAELTTLRRGIREFAPLTEQNTMKLYGYIEKLMASIKSDGTPQYVRHARCAAIAESICRSLVEKKYFSKQEMNDFWNTISTKLTEFERDFDRFIHGHMEREAFDKIYGHLRLGTYDIRTDSYRKTYFDIKTAAVKPKLKSVKGRTIDTERLQGAICDAGLDVTVDELVYFVRESVKNRELFRFEYTKSLSLMLDIIAQLGETMGIAREDMSYLEAQDILSYHSRDSYIQIINERRYMYQANTYLILPEVIFGVGNIDVIDINEARPSFITDKKVCAPVVNLDEDDKADISEKIVLLTKADPGYDWIFTKGIAGFVTKYGGAASHMAIRCAEYGIPAAVGCGSKIYTEATMMKNMELDCAKGKITKK